MKRKDASKPPASEHLADPFDPGGDPVAAFRRAQIRLLELCDLLESIADSLPSNLDRNRCAVAAGALESLLGTIHRFEEDVIYPLVQRELRRRGKPFHCIDRLCAEHCEDQGHAGELIAMLEQLASGDPPLQAETAGYMLRGFFVSMRRHLAFESDCLMALLGAGTQSEP